MSDAQPQASYIIYDATGAVRQTGQVSESVIAVMQELIAASGWPGVTDAHLVRVAELPFSAEGMTALTYVDAGAIRQRVPIQAVVSTYTIAANGVAQAVVSALPIPCTVSIGGAVTAAPFELTDGTLEITSNAVGAIVVSVTAAPPWLAWTATIYAT